MSPARAPRTPFDPGEGTERGVVWLRRILVCVTGLLLAIWLGVATAIWTRALIATQERLDDAARGGAAEGSEAAEVSLDVSVEVNGVGAR